MDTFNSKEIDFELPKDSKGRGIFIFDDDSLWECKNCGYSDTRYGKFPCRCSAMCDDPRCIKCGITFFDWNLLDWDLDEK